MKHNRIDEDRPLNLNAFNNTSTSTEGDKMGGHMVAELNFRSLLNPDVTTAGLTMSPEASDGAMSMRNILGSSTPTLSSKNSSQDERMDHFRNLLSPNQSQSSTYSGLSDPVNRAPDMTQLPVNPVEGSASGRAHANLLRDALQPTATLSAPGRSLFGPGGQGGSGQPTISGFSSLPSPTATRNESLLNNFKSPGERGPSRRP
jgi:hypothetical protein